MPELPEIEIVKRSLLKTVIKAKIIRVEIKNKNLRYKIDHLFSKKLTSGKILSISRRSKYLIFHFKKKLLLVHLGMSGKILIVRKKDNKIFKTSFYYDSNLHNKHNHIYLTLSNGLILIYNDVRRFGFFKLYDMTNFNKITFLQKLGFEPFDKLFNLKYFKKSIKNKKKNIKNLLMDQSFVSGLGNIYVNEALFLSKIKPSRSCKALKSDEIRILISNIRKILKLAISKGGSSLKDFKNTDGKSGSFQEFFRVYDHENKKCSRISCKGKIKKMIISSRSSFYCNKCQV
jgi:formamidopyrimidine-DNA glycosylase